jgi:hypothetical protein
MRTCTRIFKKDDLSINSIKKLDKKNGNENSRSIYTRGVAISSLLLGGNDAYIDQNCNDK